jgi:hypothetical protein
MALDPPDQPTQLPGRLLQRIGVGRESRSASPRWCRSAACGPAAAGRRPASRAGRRAAPDHLGAGPTHQLDQRGVGWGTGRSRPMRQHRRHPIQSLTSRPRRSEPNPERGFRYSSRSRVSIGTDRRPSRRSNSARQGQRRARRPGKRRRRRVRRAAAWPSGNSSAQLVVCGSRSRSTSGLQGMPRQENHNRVIQPQTGPRLLAFPQLSRPFNRPFFRSKEHYCPEALIRWQ